MGVFEGRTPCSDITNAFTGFPSQNCEKIKWELSLYRDGTTGRPTIFVYRGTRTTKQGRWTIAGAPASDCDRLIYRLQPDGAGQSLSLVRLGDVLLLLDHDDKVLVGDASWSNVLNRVASR